MRSELVFYKVAEIPNRYYLCRVIMVSTRRLHKPGSRFQDTINSMLSSSGTSKAENEDSPAISEWKAPAPVRRQIAA